MNHPAAPEPRLEWLDINLVDPDPNQPRRDMGDVAPLGKDMAVHRQYQPILVRPCEGRYQIVDGERRWRAAKAEGETTILCLVEQMTVEQVRAAQFSSNYFRQDFSPFELCDEFKRMCKEHDWTHQELADHLGTSRSVITETLSLANIPKPLREKLANTARVSKEILYRIARAENPAQMETLIEAALEGKSVRQIRKAAREAKEAKAKKTGTSNCSSESQEGHADSAPSDSKPPTTTPGGHCHEEEEQVSPQPDDGETESSYSEENGTAPEEEAPKSAVSGQQTEDELIVHAWWAAYNVHAVRMGDIKSLDQPLAGKKFDAWLRGAVGREVSGYRVVMMTAAVNKFVYQLVPISFPEVSLEGQDS